MRIFDIFGRKRRKEERRRREAAAGKPCSSAGGDGGYNPALYDSSAVNDSGPSHSPHSCGSAPLPYAGGSLFCSGGDSGGGGGGD
ncbi:hypothetical protein MPPM_1656 [Methylorubrum populi]|jgi:hypothetical protein|uniref:Uncharacterized protein n=1 Tax=Methylorubrum populi TaxID=223967 RepID=A0A160PF15_9HYPH|nr:hypothetical protein [Methylobacterium sp. DB1607]BAU90261.1 hypothetical protein MPPM_1656 [Methylorubrum populi]